MTISDYALAVISLRKAALVTVLVVGSAYMVMGQERRPGEAKSATDAEARAAVQKERVRRIEMLVVDMPMGDKEPPLRLSLAQLMDAFKVPGLSVAVIEDYKIAWAKGYGTIGAGSSTPVSTTTLFQAGSISKPVAATGMLALVQAGKLSLDEDVNVKLKTWKVPENEFTKEQKVTLRRLASHTAGLTVHGFPGYDVDEPVPTLVQIFNGEKPANTPAIRVDFVPGTKWRYSGGGVTIEQQLMMDVTGKPFPALMKELVLDKEGMSDSSYEQPLSAEWASRTAVGTYASGKPVHGKWHIYPEMAAAGLWTTPTDLAKFVIEIALSKQGKSNRVLTQKTIEEMFTKPPSASDFGIGFGLSANRPGEFGHDGADEGFQAMLIMNADTGQGIAMMADSDNGITLANYVLHRVAQEYGWKYAPGPWAPAEQLMLLAELRGADAVVRRYEELKSTGDSKKRPEEFVLNMIGYRVFMQAGKTEDAIKVFEKNVREYPESSNVYDSLGEAYMKADKKDLAIANYEKSLQLDPKNQNAVEQLKKLRAPK